MAVLLALTAAAALAAPVNTGHIEAELVSQEAAVPGGTVFVAVRQKITKDWHTYWRNPGDAGNATKLAWILPAGWKVGGARPGEPRQRNQNAQWRPTLKALSPAYTTKWSELLRVR